MMFRSKMAVLGGDGMRLTKKKAIEISIELWTWLAETGARGKESWPGWDRLPEMTYDCPFCQYAKRHYHPNDNCKRCPYFKVFGDCCADDSPFILWVVVEHPDDSEDRKVHAAAFLEQLRRLEAMK